MKTLDPVEWSVSTGLVPYPDAVRSMEERVAAIASGRALEQVWLQEHPPLYTAGTSAKDGDLLDARFPVFRTGRGGQYTYHGPGQLVAYVMLDLNRRGRDVRRFVRDLEEWLIVSLASLDVGGERRPGRVGIWVAGPGGREDKIAAIGVRLKQWVSYHGISLNVRPDLSHYSGIVPCGVADDGLGVTSLAALGKDISLAEADGALQRGFIEVFGPVTDRVVQESVRPLDAV
jgi:lipoyl(octanoyl) transferase